MLKKLNELFGLDDHKSRSSEQNTYTSNHSIIHNSTNVPYLQNNPLGTSIQRRTYVKAEHPSDAGDNQMKAG